MIFHFKKAIRNGGQGKLLPPLSRPKSISISVCAGRKNQNPKKTGEEARFDPNSRQKLSLTAIFRRFFLEKAALGRSCIRVCVRACIR